MALCTNCGAVMHADDTTSHICVPADVPQKGVLNRAGGIKQDIKTGLVVE